MRASEHRSAVERGIERRIRNQRKEEEERGDAHQEAGQLIEPPVASRDKNACQEPHVGRIRTPKPHLPLVHFHRPEPHHYAKNQAVAQSRKRAVVSNWLPAGFRRQKPRLSGSFLAECTDTSLP